MGVLKENIRIDSLEGLMETAREWLMRITRSTSYDEFYNGTLFLQLTDNLVLHGERAGRKRIDPWSETLKNCQLLGISDYCDIGNLRTGDARALLLLTAKLRQIWESRYKSDSYTRVEKLVDKDVSPGRLEKVQESVRMACQLMENIVQVRAERDKYKDKLVRIKELVMNSGISNIWVQEIAATIFETPRSFETNDEWGQNGLERCLKS